MSERNIAASVRTRLLNNARNTGQDFNLVITRYAIERMLYRISISKHVDSFLLKGALLFDLWFDTPHRPTRDADFLGFGSAELPHIEGIFREICAITVADGIDFQQDSVRASEIRKEANYAGVRVTLLGLLDGARCSVQIDIGFGDAVTPAPEVVEYPTLLPDLEAPKLKVYPRYTVVAEKFEAVTSLGMTNSRMKDYFDLWILARHAEFEGAILQQAIAATFGRRKTMLPRESPIGFTAAFTQDKQKQTQWQAFLRKNKLASSSLDEVTVALTTFLMPVTDAIHAGANFQFHWKVGGPWSAESTN